MNRFKNILINGKHGKPVVADMFFNGNKDPMPVIIFAHGFKGFKDWGPYDMIAESFAHAGFVFIKFNFSFNGTTPDNPTEFADLEAFGQNNFTKELDDLDTLLNWLWQHPQKERFDLNTIYLAGHSRGGAISIIKAAEDGRISKIASWASPIEFGKYISPQQLSLWQQAGVIYIENARTHQQMPLYYQLAEDAINNAHRINIHKAVKQLSIPHLIIHGTEDETVSFSDALVMHSWNTRACLTPIASANHSFGAEHPYAGQLLPPHYQQVVNETIAFFRA
ncbi:MAG TPA: dienelactone hydrolase family protein [Bacteroidia bacterium]|jgi:dienelactone hydrolase|nr:dienelactone hydrolase family protein [Bacteroidia bacterium]HCI58669.1 alpha/beta hydrolase [Bacteroidota bacterium]MCC7513226.1 dienelactone hydrolase family protein [Bacteroidia bacterium]HMU78383.1 dienelactone hydrolase family protein [Bacteroidia bacterium]HNB13606.1 dienelactone hydrolase family protein [Bacteroidia bacterium]